MPYSSKEFAHGELLSGYFWCMRVKTILSTFLPFHIDSLIAHDNLSHMLHLFSLTHPAKYVFAPPLAGFQCTDSVPRTTV